MPPFVWRSNSGALPAIEPTPPDYSGCKVGGLHHYVTAPSQSILQRRKDKQHLRSVEEKQHSGGKNTTFIVNAKIYNIFCRFLPWVPDIFWESLVPMVAAAFLFSVIFDPGFESRKCWLIYGTVIGGVSDETPSKRLILEISHLFS